MANHRVIISAFIALLFINCSLIKSSNAAGLAIYWGDSNYEDSLQSTCSTGNFKYVSINLQAHCNPYVRYGCRGLGVEIKACQSLGVKVLLSLGSRYLLSARNYDDPKRYARYIIRNYLGGDPSSSSRPFGDAILDGIDFSSPYGSSKYWHIVAESLKDDNNQTILAAAPGCQYPDATLGPVIDAGLLDSIWVKFFDNRQCQYDDSYYGSGARNLLNTWSKWERGYDGELYMQLPAAPQATRWGGYIPPDMLINNIIPKLEKTPNYGGIMLWNRFYDVSSGGNYSNAIAGASVIGNGSFIATS